MIIKPKCRGFICTSAHPVGCETNIMNQIEYVKKQQKINGAKRVLVIGGSTGYGLASRLVPTFSSGAATIGVFFEKPSSGNRTASTGWYNTAAFEKKAREEGLYARSINGDAFSNKIKQDVIELIKKDLGTVDMVIYSIAAPRRQDPETDEIYASTLKPIGELYRGKTVDIHTGIVSEVSIEPANDEEINGTVKVMGGEDWYLWMKALAEANVLAEGVVTYAFSYIGPEITYAIYSDGTIGKAKEHLDKTVSDIDEILKGLKGKSYVSVNKALVTQASSAIPVVPLYISLLYKIMKEKDVHEDCTAQIYRLFKSLSDNQQNIDEKGRVRIDDLEMQEDIQNEVDKLWGQLNTENIMELTDLEGYRKDFFNLFGFEVDGVDYEKDVEIDARIEGIE